MLNSVCFTNNGATEVNSCFEKIRKQNQATGLYRYLSGTALSILITMTSICGNQYAQQICDISFFHCPEHCLTQINEGGGVAFLPANVTLLAYNIQITTTACPHYVLTNIVHSCNLFWQRVMVNTLGLTWLPPGLEISVLIPDFIPLMSGEFWN